MKIAVVGCGALGSFYGAKLKRAGHDAHFLLRTDYEAVRSSGLTVESPNGDFHVEPRCARRPEEIGGSDLVLIGLKTTANEFLREVLPGLCSSRTMVLTLQNGLGNEEFIATLVDPTQVLGGLCFVCLNRIKAGLVRHLAHGKIVLGEYQRPPDQRTLELASMFKNAGVPCSVTDNLQRAHWEKLVWNIPFNGLGVASCVGFDALREGKSAKWCERVDCLTTDQLLADPRWETLVLELMEEVVAGARACGFAMDPTMPRTMVERTRTMGAYKPSTLLDFERGRPLELEAMFVRPLREAESAGANMFRLRGLTRLLCELDPADSEQ